MPAPDQTTDTLDHIGHTVIQHRDGETHVQHLGPEHVVEGSISIIEVPAGATVVIRHIRPRD